VTVRLGVNDYVIPNINYHDLINKEPLPLPERKISSKFNYNSTAIVEINSTEKEKILIIDDNHFINEATKNILRKILKEAGSEIEIITVSDGADIIHQIILDQSKGNEIKCIITDENMEYLNGSEAIRIIRNLERRNKIKFVNIISVTGNEDAVLSSEILKLGAQIVLSKPLPKKLISKALKDLSII
jgi:PleD family two-component response regulator